MTLQEQFPKWTIVFRPAGVSIVAALRKFDDGSERYIVANSTAELAGKLATAEKDEEGEEDADDR
jgi:hypothetical protein